ncbi:PoNe immunity protein domain-containing protein [Paucisalibacillus globulus]|uniref:PoNe immunity protein domain-containing protein n=1 Tax=Paucisalibacillus globulus TaxID=351095 RepID=UPI00047E821C|nr:PoNe immunity protein domain-containing protein [Paucisalibacillus globulus]
MRDTLKNNRYNNSYYKDYLDYELSRLEKFQRAVDNVINLRGESDRGVQSGLRTIVGTYFNIINALYSSGAPLEEIKKLFSEVVNSMKKVWNSDSGYVEMVWMLSIGIMLNISKDKMAVLEEMVKEDGLEDYLIDFLLHYSNSNWDIQAKQFKFETPYKYLYKVFDAKDKLEAESNLKKYLIKEWYSGHNDTGWYDTHKSSENIYSGYWSFESGAIAKILKLDDEVLKQVPYYPYDMTHYED